MKPELKSNDAHPEPDNTEKRMETEEDPIEELLGSVTKYNHVDGPESKSQQLRTSARVIKKMKLDSAREKETAIAAAIPVSVPEKKEKEPPPVKEETPAKVDMRKQFRPLWTPEDKNLFFEGLNEHGKDFEAIFLYITSKIKRKGLPDSGIKSKDQIRHLYYRTWHKISKHLKFSPDVKKVAQEIYGLINYGELRKRMSSVNEKTCMKLNELIYTGTVAIRSRGKIVRIRTPMCRALRRLNQLNENHYDLRLPHRVAIELRPKDVHTWMRVQAMSQNPRIRTTLPLQRRLSSLLMYLRDRWKPTMAAAYEQAISSVNEVTSECLPEKEQIERNKIILEPPVRLSPSPGVKIETPAVNLSEYFSCLSICLNAYEERTGVKVPGEQLWQYVPWAPSKHLGRSSLRRHGTKRPRSESLGDKSLLAKQIENAVKNGVQNTTDNNENCVSDSSDLPASVKEVIDEAVSTLLALKRLDPENNIGIEDVKVKTEEKITNGGEIKDEKPPPEEIKSEGKVYEISKIREGWTLDCCGTLSIGELYLMFGSDSSLVLEYSWDDPKDHLPKLEYVEVRKDIITTDTEDRTNVLQSIAEKKESTDMEVEENKEKLTGLSLALKRLLSVAKLHYRKNIIKCPCGHVCGNTTKASSKARAAPKVPKHEPVEIQPKQEGVSPTVMNACPTVDIPCVPATSYRPVRTLSPAFLLQKQISNAQSLRAQLERLRPRFCGRRGRRPRAKPVFVERKLPLLANKGDQAHQILQMNIISQDKLEITPMTVTTKTIDNLPSTSQQTLEDETAMVNDVVPTIQVNESPDVAFNTIPTESGLSTVKSLDICDNAVMSASRASSPTGISNFLEMALASQHQKNMMLNTEIHIKDEGEVPSFAGLLSENNTTPPSSPSRILKENENQWINAEVADFSFSSFLGHLESPMKQTSSIAGDDTRLSQDVDAQLQSLLNESSIDYTAKFADLAAQVVSETKK